MAQGYDARSQTSDHCFNFSGAHHVRKNIIQWGHKCRDCAFSFCDGIYFQLSSCSDDCFGNVVWDSIFEIGGNYVKN